MKGVKLSTAKFERSPQILTHFPFGFSTRQNNNNKQKLAKDSIAIDPKHLLQLTLYHTKMVEIMHFHCIKELLPYTIVIMIHFFASGVGCSHETGSHGVL